MRGQPHLRVPALAVLTCAILAGCTTGGTSSAFRHAPAPPPRPTASRSRVTGPVGSPGNPLLLTCAQEAFPGYPARPIPPHPQPAELAIGPLFIANGKRLATANPASFGDHGSYKVAFVLLPGSAVTVTIAAPARGQVVIDIPGSPVGGVAAASYHSCPNATGFFAQGFAFTHHGQTRGCVPLDVTIGHRPQVHRVMLSLFAGTCPP